MSRPFVPPGTETHYTPDRPVAVTHVRLEVTLDMEARSVRGRSELTLSARREQVTAVELHAVDMQIEEADVTVDGAPAAASSYDGQRLRVELGRACARGESVVVGVGYRATPRRGLYFIGPDAYHPDRPAECWTQGQDEDSRHWWPCIDAPIEKATSEIVCTAPRGLFVLSNGDLRERKDLDDQHTRWHYALDLPHAPYLVTLVCGRFTEIKERAPETGVDVYYFVAPGREDDARRSFSRTPQMIDFFSRRIGIPYPQKRYSQIVVSEFIFGGMENTTATTLTDQSLLDARAALDHDVEALVSHELAHQWWGDLLTCREWPEAWLNEGFATYFEYVWREHAKGRDEADVEVLADADSYLAESGTYQRAIVCRQYEEPIDLFDSHLYEKGGRVLHMLRHEIGDEAFWRALALYAERHLHRSVETRDLARAVEEASGRNLDRFFDQWVASPGHPELEGDWRWDPEAGMGTLRLEQKQAGDKVFAFTAPIRFEVGGEEREQRVTVRERSHAFEFRLPVAPTQVVFDPGDVVLKTIKLDKPRPLWVRQLKAARFAVDRVLAARALGERPEPAAVVALREALESDPLWAVRTAAATALGRTRRADALDALENARGQEHPRVRRAVAAALGEYRGDARAGALLARWVEEGDPSYFVEANAALALGRTRSPAAVEVLSRALDRPAFQDVIRARALDGLGATGDEAALPVARAQYRPAASFQVRRAAIAAVARLAEGTLEARRARELLETALDDRDFRVRIEAASSLAMLGDPRAVAALERAAAAELDGRARRRLKEAIAELRDRGRPPERMRKLEEEIERLRGEGIKTKERLEKLEARTAGSGEGGGSRGPRDREGSARRPRPRVRRPPKPPRPPRRR
jgi:aminopeptidase N